MDKTLIRKIIASLNAVALLFMQVLCGVSISLLIPKAVFASVNCGQTTTSGTAQVINVVVTRWSPCTTGANTLGYTVVSANVYIGAVGAGKLYMSIYTNSSSVPSVPICTDTTGQNPVGTSVNSDVLSGCGTLAASTIYWVGWQASDPTTADIYNLTTCPDGIYSQYNNSTVAGTWPNPAAVTGSAGACFTAYLILNAITTTAKSAPAGMMQ